MESVQTVFDLQLWQKQNADAISQVQTRVDTGLGPRTYEVKAKQVIVANRELLKYAEIQK